MPGGGSSGSRLDAAAVAGKWLETSLVAAGPASNTKRKHVDLNKGDDVPFRSAQSDVCRPPPCAPPQHHGLDSTRQAPSRPCRASRRSLTFDVVLTATPSGLR
jgi:hypothetical protein